MSDAWWSAAFGPREPERPPIGSKPRARSQQPVLPPAHDHLARGELTASDAAELAVLKSQMRRVVGFDCDGYKEKCMRRRIAVRMRACGIHRYADYAALLDRDEDERRKLLDAVTINVSKFFRNPPAWELLRAKVIPHLFTLDTPVINIWSAGCAAGEEAYSLAIMVMEHAEQTGADTGRFRILATDVDARALDQARSGEYGEFAFTDATAAMRRRWFVGPGARRIRPEIQRLVRFDALDLLRDVYPTGQHLILCRNVVIYFERPVQERVFNSFHAALAPGGHLLLGKVEALFGRVANLFRPVSPRERLFRAS